MTDDLEDYTCGVAVNVHVSVEVPDLVTDAEVIINALYPDVNEDVQAVFDELIALFDTLEVTTGTDALTLISDITHLIASIYDELTSGQQDDIDGATDIINEITVVVTPELSVPTHFYPGKTVRYDQSTDFVSPTGTTLTVAADLKRNGHDGYITNDAAEIFRVEIEDPEEGFGGAHKLKKDETMDLAMLNIKNIRLKGAANCEYRALVV